MTLLRVVLVGALGLLACATPLPPAEGVRAEHAPVTTLPRPWPLYASRAPLPARPIAPEERDRLRGLIYRVDGEAWLARLHPNDALVHAKAAERMARDASARLAVHERLRPEAAELERAAWALSEAAQRENPVDVRARAARVQDQVRRIDDTLPEF
jgi:hypothetical protein